LTVSLEDIRLIAEVEFASIVDYVEPIGAKLRLVLSDSSYVDVWLSRKLKGRFGFHWERRHIDGSFYRYDNFPNTNWRNVSTYPRHFHDGSQDNVVVSPFHQEISQGFREFMAFARGKLSVMLRAKP
jgi:hypothetical protein